MFLDLLDPDPDPVVRGTNPAPDPVPSKTITPTVRDFSMTSFLKNDVIVASKSKKQET
jgi:hypothetical protein